MKYGVTANLTADLTINTDFAQVEIDEQQVNLTRFNLFLPEKREFFLEGRGLFDFARGGASGGGNPFGGGTSDTPYLFYTRRIGLNRNRIVPIDAGGRLTGKIGAFGVGVMNIQAGDEEVSRTPSTNFTVVRLKRDILRRSTIGAMFTNRNESVVTPDGSNQAYGVDAALGFYQNIAIGAYYAETRTTDVSGDNESYQGKFDWSPDRYGVSAEVLKVGQGVQSGSRLPAAHRLYAIVRLGAFQPAAHIIQAGSQVHVASQLRVLRERRRRRGVTPGHRQVQRRVQQQRRLQRRSERQLRPAADAVCAGARSRRFRSAGITTTTC